MHKLELSPGPEGQRSVCCARAERWLVVPASRLALLALLLVVATLTLLTFESHTCAPTTAGFLKLAATRRLDQPDDFLFCLERDRRENPAYFVPDTVIFFNWADPAPSEAIEKSPHFRKKAEGRTFVAFERI